MEELEKVDIIRERTGVSYKEAKEALDKAGSDVVMALIDIEGRDRSLMEVVQEQGKKVVGKVRTYVNKGSHRKIKIKKGDRTLFEVPASVGAMGVVGALIVPELALVGAIGAIASNINLEVDKEPKDKGEEDSDI